MISKSEYINSWKRFGEANLDWVKGKYLIANGFEREHVSISSNHYGTSRSITYADGTKSRGITQADTKKKFVVNYSGYGIGSKILGFANSENKAKQIAMRFMGEVLPICFQKDIDGWNCYNVLDKDGRCNLDHSLPLHQTYYCECPIPVLKELIEA